MKSRFVCFRNSIAYSLNLVTLRTSPNYKTCELWFDYRNRCLKLKDEEFTVTIIINK